MKFRHFCTDQFKKDCTKIKPSADIHKGTLSLFTIMYIVDDLCGTLIGLVHSPLVQNFMKNLVTTLVSPIFLPLFSANNIYDGTFY